MCGRALPRRAAREVSWGKAGAELPHSKGWLQKAIGLRVGSRGLGGERKAGAELPHSRVSFGSGMRPGMRPGMHSTFTSAVRAGAARVRTCSYPCGAATHATCSYMLPAATGAYLQPMLPAAHAELQLPMRTCSPCYRRLPMRSCGWPREVTGWVRRGVSRSPFFDGRGEIGWSRNRPPAASLHESWYPAEATCG